MNEEEIKKEQPKAEQKNEVKNEVEKVENTKEAKNPFPLEPRMREIIIHTNGNKVAIVKNESAGTLELMSILEALLQSIARR